MMEQREDSSPTSSKVYKLVDFYNSSDPNFWPNVTQCVQSYSPINESFNSIEFELTSPSGNLTSNTQILQECLKLQVGSPPYILVTWVQIIWIFLFAFIITVTVIGNSLVIWIILAHKRMRTITNLFLLNLALSDLLMATFNTAFNFTWMLNSHWPFGSLYCSINNFIAHLTVFSSVFTLTAMSIDRYVAIVRPLSSRMSRRTAWTILNSIWVVGCLVASPNLLFSLTVTYIYPEGSYRTICFLRWPDGFAGYSSLDYMYNILFLIVTYIVPVIALATTYPHMICVLWGSESIGEITERHKSAIKAKKKIVRMLITVVFIFVVCWLPYHIYFLVIFHFPKISTHHNIQNIYLAIYWLAMSNSMYNPVIYYKMNGRFRRYFQSILCFCWPNLQDSGGKWNNLQMRHLVGRKPYYRSNTNNNISTRSTRSCKSITNGSLDIPKETSLLNNGFDLHRREVSPGSQARSKELF